MIRLPERLLLVSSALPPEPSGAAVVLGRLFRGVNPDDYRIATFEFADHNAVAAEEALPAKIFRLASEWQQPQQTAYALAPIRSVRRFGLETVRRARVLAELIASENCAAVMGVSGANPNLGASYLAARMTGRPFFVCMFDEWRYQLVDTSLRRAMAVLQARVLRGANGVMVPSDTLAQSFARRHGCACTVIRNPVDDADLAEPPAVDREWPAGGNISIVYTGQVYEAQLDALLRMTDALAAPALRGAKLHIYTAQHAADLKRRGLEERAEIHPHLPADQIRSVQRAADVLFLPLAFASPYPQIIRTAAPTKLGEYMASGRPILAHVPSGSFVATYGRREGIAEVVDAPAPELLVDAVRRIARDPDRRRRLGLRARTLAEREFSIATAQRKFIELLLSGRRHMAA